MEKTNVNLFFVSIVVFYSFSWVFESLLRVWPRSPRHSFERSSAKDVMTVVYCNQFLVLLPFMICLDHFQLTQYRDGIDFLELVWSLFMGQLTYYIVFHALHKILHWPRLYRFHKLHHSTRALRASTAFYMSALDFFLEIVAPMSVWFLLYPQERFSHACIMVSLGTVMGMYQHSGYDFFPNSLLFSTSEHFQHHNNIRNTVTNSLTN